MKMNSQLTHGIINKHNSLLNQKLLAITNSRFTHGIVSKHNSLVVQKSSTKTESPSTQNASVKTNLWQTHGVISEQN
jgi:hypothetical protein